VETKYDVTGIGNAIVDILVHADDALLDVEGLTKGAMALIDAEESRRLYERIGAAIECSGGSAANTIAGLASLGGAGAFIGKVHDDQLGKVFRHDIQALGVTFDSAPTTEGPPTATSMILVTPDAERTMLTFLGACVDLSPGDVDEDLIAASKITYLEGYLWDRPSAKGAFLKAAEVAHQAGRKVSLSLSDPFCVGRHRDEFRDLVARHVDILFANEEEITALYQADDFDAALDQVRGHCEIAALTRGEKGSVIVNGADVYTVPADPVDRLIDTTGAGDAYAAGFLHGVTTGRDMTVCGRIGGICAAEVISHLGARPDVSLKKRVEEKLS
jgi:sugar/nucleoside kinase (ribokinase family)